MIQIAGVPPLEARRLWPIAGPWTADALERATVSVSLEVMLEAIEDGRVELWLVLEDGRPVASFTTLVEGDGLNWFTMGGHGVDRWLPDCERVVVERAKSLGLKAARMRGRRGWLPKLKALGWHEASITMTKDVCDA